MMYTKQQLEEGVPKHVSAEAEDAVMEFLWARYQEDPQGAPSRYIGLYWMKSEIRPMTEDERQASIQREQANG